MKIFFLLSIQIAYCSGVFCQQCPPSGLKIQSPICDTPKNLRANNINCLSINLTWQGNKEQQYIVQAAGADNAANTLFEVRPAKYNCDESGSCTATISVQQGAILNWNVQAICDINGVVIYSPVVQAKQTTIPYCNTIAANATTNADTKKMRVYPNPTTASLTVEYYSKTAGSIKLTVFDMSGRKLYNQPANIAIGRNSYLLDLHNLLPGSYLLEVKNGGEASRIKFLLLRN